MRGEVVSFQKEQGMIHQTLMQLEEASGSMTARELKRVIQGLEKQLMPTTASKERVAVG